LNYEDFKSPKGVYCSKPNYTGYCIDFLNSREFIIYGFTDYGETSMNYGKHWRLGNRVFLKYSKIPEKYKYKSKSFFKISKVDSKTDSTRLHVKGFDLDSTNSGFIDLTIRDKDTGNVILNGGSLYSNESEVTLPNHSGEVILESSYSLSPVKIPILEPGDYEIEIYFDPAGIPSYNSLSGIFQKFRRKKEKGKVFLERRKNGYVTRIFKPNEK